MKSKLSLKEITQLTIAFAMTIFMISVILTVLTSKIYSGSFVVRSEFKVQQTIEIIEKNANHGPFNIWKPGYHTENLTDGTKIFKYHFLSGNKELSLE